MNTGTDFLMDLVLKHILRFFFALFLISAAGILIRAYLRRWAFDFINTRLINSAGTREDLLRADPEQFEHLCRLLFQRQGYTVHTTSMCNDGGVDIVGSKDGERIVVQCKRYTRKSVGRPELQQFYGTFDDQHAQHGFFITMSRFSKPAMEFAARKPITLVDGDDLVRWINRYADGQVREAAFQSEASGYDAVCTACGCETKLPFKPVKDKPVYCRECYKARRRVA